MASIAAVLRDPGDRAAVCQAAGGARHVLFCADADQLATVAAPGGLTGIIVEWSGPLIDLESLVQGLKGQPDPPPLVMYGPLTVAWARALLALARSGLDVRAVLRGFEELGPAARALCGTRPQPVADSVILRRVAPLLRGAARQLVVGAVVAGRRRIGVGGLATLCGLAVRTVERRLIQAHLPQAWRLLGWCTSLHALWDVDVLDWSVKRAARECGFRSSAALSTYVRRHTGATLTGLCELNGFSGLLDRFSMVLAGTGRAARGQSRGWGA